MEFRFCEFPDCSRQWDVNGKMKFEKEKCGNLVVVENDSGGYDIINISINPIEIIYCENNLEKAFEWCVHNSDKYLDAISFKNQINAEFALYSEFRKPCDIDELCKIANEYYGIQLTLTSDNLMDIVKSGGKSWEEEIEYNNKKYTIFYKVYGKNGDTKELYKIYIA